LTAHAREAGIDSSASEGLSQLGEISELLILAAILAMAAALISSIWQRRISLAGLRLEGTRPDRLRRILLMETVLMLSAGCLTGTIAGVYGQLVIDGYLKHVTGFPVASFATGQRPLEIFLFVVAIVLGAASIAGWLASRVAPTFALDE
jgi:ABC-type lipoprotein release transport system permease subunit